MGGILREGFHCRISIFGIQSTGESSLLNSMQFLDSFSGTGFFSSDVVLVPPCKRDFPWKWDWAGENFGCDSSDLT